MTAAIDQRSFDAINRAAVEAGEDYRDRPPARMRPDRHEVMNSIGSGIQHSLRDGILVDCATALQPRGRVHYFVNDSNAPMAMVWVYAALTPARIVVDERCAVEQGVAWER